MIIVHYDENKSPISLKKTEWKSIYDLLMGGFESLGEDDDESEEDIIDKSKLHKYGY